MSPSTGIGPISALFSNSFLPNFFTSVLINGVLCLKGFPIPTFLPDWVQPARANIDMKKRI